jgi:hypothetical protein
MASDPLRPKIPSDPFTLKPSDGNLADSAAASSTTIPNPAERQTATVRYVDRADLAETFADSITGLLFDGQTLRIEFGVTRIDEVKPNSPITGRRYPACRVVLPPATAIELINRMQQIAAGLAQAGVVKAPQRPTETKVG